MFRSKKDIKRICFIAGLAVLLVGCSDGASVAGGTGSEAGETELAAITFVAPNNKQPLARAVARIWTMDESGMKNTRTDTLDANGTVNVPANDEQAFLLEVNLDDSLAAMRWMPAKNIKPQTITATATTTLKGTIQNQGKPVEGALVKVLSKSAHTDKQGDFVLTGLPEGVHYAFVESEFGKHFYQLQTDHEGSISTNTIDISEGDFTVIEDFENWKSRRTLIGKSFGQGWWFICTDSLQGGKSQVNGTTDDNNILVAGDSAKDGQSLHLIFDIDEDTDGHYGVAGFAIGDDFDEKEMPAFYDLRATKAISFDAKGTGKIHLQITKRGANGEREYFDTKPLTLTESWQHFTVTADDFSTDFAAINSLNFMVNEDAEVFLDNIRLDGISPSTWPSLGMEF